MVVVAEEKRELLNKNRAIFIDLKIQNSKSCNSKINLKNTQVVCLLSRFLKANLKSFKITRIKKS